MSSEASRPHTFGHLPHDDLMGQEVRPPTGRVKETNDGGQSSRAAGEPGVATRSRFCWNPPNRAETSPPLRRRAEWLVVIVLLAAGAATRVPMLWRIEPTNDELLHLESWRNRYWSNDQFPVFRERLDINWMWRQTVHSPHSSPAIILWIPEM